MPTEATAAAAGYLSRLLISADRSAKAKCENDILLRQLTSIVNFQRKLSLRQLLLFYRGIKLLFIIGENYENCDDRNKLGAAKFRLAALILDPHPRE